MDLVTFKSTYKPSNRRPSQQRLPAQASQPVPVVDDEEQRIQQLFNQLCERSALLITTDMKNGLELEDVVDAVFDDETWEGLMREVSHLESPSRHNFNEPETVEERFPWALDPALSPGTRSLVRRVVALMNAVFLAHINLERAGCRVPASSSRDRQLDDHLWFLTDATLPPALRRGMLAHRRASVALIAVYPIMGGVSPPTQQDFRLGLNLLRLTARGYEEYLGVIANLAQAKVTMVPPDGSDLSESNVDSIVPFREAMTRAGETLGDPA